MGWWAGVQAACSLQGKPAPSPAPATMIAGLISHLVESDPGNFQPMNSNFGLIPRPSTLPALSAVDGLRAGPNRKAPGKKRKELQAEEALRSCEAWISGLQD